MKLSVQMCEIFDFKATRYCRIAMPTNCNYNLKLFVCVSVCCCRLLHFKTKRNLCRETDPHLYSIPRSGSILNKYVCIHRGPEVSICKLQLLLFFFFLLHCMCVYCFSIFLFLCCACCCTLFSLWLVVFPIDGFVFAPYGRLACTARLPICVICCALCCKSGSMVVELWSCATTARVDECAVARV